MSQSFNASPASLALASPLPAFTPVRQRSAHGALDTTPTTSLSFTIDTATSSPPPSQSPSQSQSLRARCVRWTSPLFRSRSIIIALLFSSSIIFFLFTLPMMHHMPLDDPLAQSLTASPVLYAVTGGHGRSLLDSLQNRNANIASKCVNSRSGRDLLVDSNGSVCLRDDINDTSGCCVTDNVIDRLSCKSCRHDLKCCHSYEYCISCCLSNSSSLATRAFAQCQETCRTSSRSIKHGNTYKHSYHHCYSKEEGKLSVDASLVSLVKAEVGQSCDTACNTYRGNVSVSDSGSGSVNYVCVDSLLPNINNCSVMQSQFSCAPCQQSEGADQPAYVPMTAPSNFPRGSCLVHKDNRTLTCDGKHEMTQRLCPCVDSEHVALNVEASDSESDGGSVD